MDTLIALGTGAAYLAGTWELARTMLVLFAGPHLVHVPMEAGAMGSMYFADAAMILTFISLGKFLETKARGRASQAIRKLMDLSPPEATVFATASRNGSPRGPCRRARRSSSGRAKRSRWTEDRHLARRAWTNRG